MKTVKHKPSKSHGHVQTYRCTWIKSRRACQPRTAVTFLLEKEVRCGCGRKVDGEELEGLQALAEVIDVGLLVGWGMGGSRGHPGPN